MSDRMFVTEIDGASDPEGFSPPRKVEPRKRVHSFAEVARMLKPGEEAEVTVLTKTSDVFPDGILACFRKVGIDVETPNEYWVSRPQMGA